MAVPRSIFILTGAGVSAESGVPTFRGPDGLWEGHRVEDVATPEGFTRDRQLVFRFYNERRRKLLDGIEPNPAHRTLARLQREFSGSVTLVTQNINDLHERGGSTGVIHMHGELLKARCTRCHQVLDWKTDMTDTSRCSGCERTGTLRPHVVWFGEMPLFMDEIGAAIEAADLFLAVGTSGQVYPAAGFVSLAAACGARTVEINLEPTKTSSLFDEHICGPAGTELPAWVDRILAEYR